MALPTKMVYFLATYYSNGGKDIPEKISQQMWQTWEDDNFDSAWFISKPLYVLHSDTVLSAQGIDVW